jgi:arsenite-activated ATPase ArsA
MIVSNVIPIRKLLLLSSLCFSSRVSSFQGVSFPHYRTTTTTTTNKLATAASEETRKHPPGNSFLHLPTKKGHHAPSNYNPTTSCLFSVQNLIDSLTTSATSGTPRTVFVGGKGGVGKTTVSSSLAVTLATDISSDLKILVVSTDPAHSLGDALDVDLKSLPGKPILMTDPLTAGRLYAMEVDTEAALEKFQDALETFDVNKLSEALGVQPEFLEGLGLSEFSNLLNNPPPGLDELVALSNILNDPSITKEFDVVIVDTAPTGHTLRMLALPEFLDGFLGKLLELRMKLSGVANMLQSFLGGGDAAASRAKTVDNALNQLEEFRTQMGSLRRQLKDGDRTDFVVVSVPTKLSVNESKGLMKELCDQGVKVSNVVINQCVFGEDENSDSGEAMKKYYERRKAGQTRWIHELKAATDKVSSSKEYKSNGEGSIHVTEVPFFDVELVGTPALSYLGQSSYANNPNFEHLLHDSGAEPRFVICGGKGGVGKTTTSSSLAVTMAASGRNVALVSTDPAHSLGDVFDIDFSGGDLVDVPLIGVPPTDGSLSVLEVDPSKSLGEFKRLIDNLIGSGESSSASGTSGDLSKTLKELGEVFDTLPAGTDEVVALAKVVSLVKKGGFDRIVLDTAPTGHTLRMLSTPAFISDLIDKVLSIAQKVNSNPMIKMMISNAAKGEDLDDTVKAAKNALLSFQFQMYDLEDIFSNAEQTEFLIVTVPTELAVRESVRLLNELTFEAPDMPIKVRNIVANQVLREDGSDVSLFLNKVSLGQQNSVRDLRNEAQQMGSSIEITEVPYLDTEPRGVFGLKVLSAELLKEDAIIAN